MVISLILDLILVALVLFITALSAAPIIFSACPGARWLTKMSIAFVTGFALIELAGILCSFLGFHSLLLQLGVVIAGLAWFFCNRKKILSRKAIALDREDGAVLAIAALYLVACLLFFDRIIIWMGGDSLAHAEVIRMLLDGNVIPVSVPPFGSYWEYYPKGFHLFSYPWASVFPLPNIVQTIPVLITTITPLLFYSVARELSRKDEAIYVFILACVVFSAPYSNLIWAGYPTITAEMFLVAALLSVIVDKRLLPVFLAGVLFSHARLLALTIVVLLFWLIGSRMSSSLPDKRKRQLALIAAAGIMAVASACLILPIHRPEFLVSIVSSQSTASEYAARWYPAFLSLFGAAIAFFRRDRMGILALSWAAAVSCVVLLADVGLLSFIGTADRLLLDLYLPLSLLAASALSRMDGSDSRIRASFILILVLCGFFGMGAVFHSYTASWAIPSADYDAIQWLGKQNFSDALCINLDETGAWVYPLTGMTVAHHRMLRPDRGIGLGAIRSIIANPARPGVIKALNASGYNRSLIYVSYVSLARQGYVPPFAQHSGKFPSVNLNFSKDSYDLIYDKGARIYGYPRGAFLNAK